MRNDLDAFRYLLSAPPRHGKTEALRQCLGVDFARPGPDHTVIRVVRIPSTKPGWPKQPSQPSIGEAMPNPNQSSPAPKKPALPRELRTKKAQAAIAQIVQDRLQPLLCHQAEYQREIERLREQVAKANAEAANLRDKNRAQAETIGTQLATFAKIRAVADYGGSVGPSHAFEMRHALGHAEPGAGPVQPIPPAPIDHAERAGYLAGALASIRVLAS